MKYCTAIPTFIEDETKMSPFAHRLYFRLKRRMDEQGFCHDNLDTLAEELKMKKFQIIKAEKELMNAGILILADHISTRSIDNE